MIQVTVKFFAFARDLAGVDQLSLTLPERSTAAFVLEEVALQHPSFLHWKSHLRLAVNCEYVSLSYLMQDNDEVAIIPPVSGG